MFRDCLRVDEPAVDSRGGKDTTQIAVISKRIFKHGRLTKFQCKNSQYPASVQPLSGNSTVAVSRRRPPVVAIVLWQFVCVTKSTSDDR